LAKKKGGNGLLVLVGLAAAAAGGGALLLSNRASGSTGGGGGAGGTTYQVGVSVADSSSGAAIQAALVQIGTLGQPTDQAGSALFNIAAGSYLLSVTASGYEPYSESIQVSGDETLPPIGLTRVSTPPPTPCYQLVPTVLSVPETDVAEMAWMVSVDWSNRIGKVGIIDSNPTGCPGSACSEIDTGTATYVHTIQGTLVDSAGAPVCNATIQAKVSQGSVPWRTQDGLAGVALFGVGLPALVFGPPAPVVTDDNGNFAVDIFVTLQVTQGNAGLGTDAAGSGGGLAQAPNSVVFSVAGYPLVRGSTSLNVQMLVCSTNTVTGC
jgi:hypothetical protein